MLIQWGVICGRIFTRHTTTGELLLHLSTTQKNKTTSDRLKAHPYSPVLLR